MRCSQYPIVPRRRLPSNADISVCCTIGHHWRVASGRLRDDFHKIIIGTGMIGEAVSTTECVTARFKTCSYLNTSSYGGRGLHFVIVKSTPLDWIVDVAIHFWIPVNLVRPRTSNSLDNTSRTVQLLFVLFGLKSWFLPRNAVLARYLLSSCVRLSVRQSVFTIRSYRQTDDRRQTELRQQRPERNVVTFG